MRLTIPLDAYPVHLLAPAADAAGRTSPYISLKNAVKAWIICYIEQGNAATILLSPLQATAVAGTGSKAIAAARIYSNADAAAAVALAEQAEATTFTTSAAVKKKFVIFELDLAKVMDVANDFDCIAISTGASNAANITSAFLFLQPRHRATVPLDPLVD